MKSTKSSRATHQKREILCCQATNLCSDKSNMEFEGSSFFRQRIVCSVLSAKCIKINNIRSNEKTPGLAGKISSFHFLDEEILLKISRL